MIARLAWYAAIFGLSMLIAALQIDRASERFPALAGLVPAPLRNFAQVHVAAEAAEGGGTAAALTEARRLVARRPVPAEHLTMLAVAQARAGDEAALTVQSAARRGWREPLAQEAMLRLALAAGDSPEAARRYAALFVRSATPDAMLQTLAVPVLGDPGGPGRSTFAGIVAGAQRWHQLFLRRGPTVLPPDAFAEIIALALERGARFDCAELAAVIAPLARSGDQGVARVAEPLRSACPK